MVSRVPLDEARVKERKRLERERKREAEQRAVKEAEELKRKEEERQKQIQAERFTVIFHSPKDPSKVKWSISSLVWIRNVTLGDILFTGSGGEGAKAPRGGEEEEGTDLVATARGGGGCTTSLCVGALERAV